MNVTTRKKVKSKNKNKTLKKYNNKNQYTNNSEKYFLTNLTKAMKPSHIKLKDDFYSYINKKWLKEFKVNPQQKYIYQVDDYRLVQHNVYIQLLDIVKNYTENPDTKHTSKAINMKNLYTSMHNLNNDQQSKMYAEMALNKIDNLMKDKSNLWKLLAMINKNEIISMSCPFIWSIKGDDKNPGVYISHLEPLTMPLIDINIYFDDGTNIEYKKKYRKRYLYYLKILFYNAFGKNHTFNVNDVYNCQVKLIYAIGCNEYTKLKNKKIYNVVTEEEAKKTFLFDWSEFAKELGFKHIPNKFVTTNINYLMCTTKLLIKEWDTPEWRTYWIYIYIRQQQRFNKRGVFNYFNFHAKFLRGQEEPINRNITPIFPLCYAYNSFLTNEYIKLYNNEKNINYVVNLSNELKNAFKQILMQNKWLENKTKNICIKKIENITVVVGYPNKMLTVDPRIDYINNDIWYNLTKISEWRHNKFLESVGNSLINIPFIDWASVPPKLMGQQVYTVNALYIQRNNRIYIPLAYIQKPFLDLTKGIEYNLAYIGFTIAHELSHSLDDIGYLYDEHGVLKDWWTPKDITNFQRIQNNVIKQYKSFAMRDGIEYDVLNTIGESISDISGLNICVEYLRNYQEQRQEILPIKILSFEEFFVYFAIQEKQKIKKKSLYALLKTNPHPLDQYRTNIPLSRNPIFRKIFDIKKEDKMWWNSTNRIWEE
jgi:endothelin-converting enzyme/putative endopeptidase